MSNEVCEKVMGKVFRCAGPDDGGNDVYECVNLLATIPPSMVDELIGAFEFAKDAELGQQFILNPKSKSGRKPIKTFLGEEKLSATNKTLFFENQKKENQK
jgi:hypothetical protein